MATANIFMSSCDLLEKSYLCGINNNKKGRDRRMFYVVICLKSLTFVVSITTSDRSKRIGLLL